MKVCRREASIKCEACYLLAVCGFSDNDLGLEQMRADELGVVHVETWEAMTKEIIREQVVMWDSEVRKVTPWDEMWRP